MPPPAHAMNKTSLSLRRTFAIITALFVVVATSTCLVGYVNYRLSSVSSRHTNELTHLNLPALQALARLEEATLKYNAANIEFVLAKDDAGMAAKAKTADLWGSRISTNLDALDGLIHTPETDQRVSRFRQSLGVYQAAVARLQKALRDGDFDKAMSTLDNDVAKAKQALDADLGGISDTFFALSTQASDSVSQAVTRNLTITIACTAASTLVILFATAFVQVISVRTTRVIARNLNSLSAGSDSVQHGAGSLTSGSQALAQGSSAQAASLEETSRSISTILGDQHS